MTKILVVGGGAREHAVIWKLKQSPEVEKIFCSPGNGGIAGLAALIPACAECDWNSYADFVTQNKIDLTFVGPEAPLTAGIVDAFRKRGLKIVGPDQNAAKLEGSKIFAKQFMKKYGIPTAPFEVFDRPSDAIKYVSKFFGSNPSASLVVKADGLAAGKGVSVCETLEDAKNAVEQMMVKKAFGAAGEKIIIEERLRGLELSLMALCDGKTVKPLLPARDYKRVFDDNQGPNTGGMGAICPCPVPDETLQRIDREVVQPFLKGIQTEKLDYRGIIYFGLMLTDNGPFVLEFNARFGDPETQVVLPLIESDLLELFYAVIDQKLEHVPLKVSQQACVGVVCASGGYPGKFESHQEIHGLESASVNDGVAVFHAGTSQVKGKYFTGGGRVLTVTARQPSLKEARRKAYGAVFKIEFNKMHFRNDIGKEI